MVYAAARLQSVMTVHSQGLHIESYVSQGLINGLYVYSISLQLAFIHLYFNNTVQCNSMQISNHSDKYLRHKYCTKCYFPIEV